jgi:hypothetical protein
MLVQTSIQLFKVRLQRSLLYWVLAFARTTNIQDHAYILCFFLCAVCGQ